MTDDRFEELLSSLRDEHNAPPPTPREEIWAKLQSASGQSTPRRAKPRVRPVFWWPLAAAALLLLGISVGRWTKPPVVLPVATTTPEAVLEEQNRVDPYAIVAARHLDRAETLLTHFENERVPAISQVQLASWARQLLSDTRLLLDSPAIGEPATRDLLSDVELLLALIVQLDRDDDPRAIAEGLRRSGILDRLRSRIPAESV